MRYNLLIVRPNGYIHANALHEVAESVFYGLRHLGYSVTWHENQVERAAVNIVFGAHLAPMDQLLLLPANSILYNLEPFSVGSAWSVSSARQLAHLTQWDYSQRNIRHLAAAGWSQLPIHVPLGYVPELTRITPAATEDIDVLFYGSINERRDQLLQRLRATGVNLLQVFGVYGNERDALIARSKLVLNLHFYPASIFEMPRVAYLLANAKAVVAECHDTTEIDADIRDGLALSEYANLPNRCLELLADTDQRHYLQQRGLHLMQQRSMSTILRLALGLTE